jgi:dihydrofolate reductase
MGYLPGRVNIVMTSKHTKPDYEIQNTLYSNTDIVLANSLSQIFDYLRHHNNKNYKPIVIGGASIYQYFLNYDLIERIFLTRIRYKFENVDTGIDNLYEAGFDCHTNHPLFIPTDYSSWTKSTKTYKDEDGNEKPYEFYIHTLTKT